MVLCALSWNCLKVCQISVHGLGQECHMVKVLSWDRSRYLFEGNVLCTFYSAWGWIIWTFIFCIFTIVQLWIAIMAVGTEFSSKIAIWNVHWYVIYIGLTKVPVVIYYYAIIARFLTQTMFHQIKTVSNELERMWKVSWPQLTQSQHLP